MYEVFYNEQVFSKIKQEENRNYPSIKSCSLEVEKWERGKSELWNSDKYEVWLIVSTKVKRF